MFTVREEVVNNVSVYRIEDSFDAAAKRIVKYTTNIIDVDEMSYFILYDSNMDIKVEVHKYLSIKKHQLADNTLALMLYDLKLLYTFIVN